MKKEIKLLKAIRIVTLLSVLLCMLTLLNNQSYAEEQRTDLSELTEKVVEVTKTEKNTIDKVIKFVEDGKEGIAQLIGAPKIIDEQIKIEEQEVTDMIIDFGEGEPLPVYPYYRKIGEDNVYTGILTLDPTLNETKEVSGVQTLYAQEPIYDYKINVSTREFNAEGVLQGTSYSWGHTNNHSSYIDENNRPFVKESAKKLSSVRTDNPDGSYTIVDEWQGKYLSINQKTKQVDGTYTVTIGHYNGTISSEEHIYTFLARYFVALMSKAMEEANYGEVANAEYPNDPVNIATGNFYSNDTDLKLLDLGMTLQAKRYYNAQDEREGILGKSWRFHYESYIEEVEGENQLKVIYPSGRTGIYVYDQETGEYVALPGFYDQLKKETDGTYTLTLRNKTKYIYNATKKLSKIQNRQGNEANLTYNGQGQLTKITGPQGKYISITYDQNRINKVTDSSGRSITYTYNNNLLEKVMDETGAFTQYTYEENKIKTMTDKNGKVFLTNDYDKFGRVIKQTDGNGGEIIYDYNIETKENFYHNVKTGEKIKYQYNKKYYITKKIYDDGTYEAYTYDEKGNKITSRNRNGHITTFEYDDRNNIIKTVSPAPYNYETKITYDEHDNITKITKPNGIEENFTYDNKGNLIKIEKQIDEVSKAVTAYTYDTQGRKLTETNPLGFKTTYEYSSTSPLPIKVTDPEGNTVSYTYDNVNRIKTVTRAGNSLTYEYDHLSNITKVIDQNGNITRMKYDNMGNLIKTIQPNQYDSATDDGLGTTYQYNDMDKRIKTIDPLGNIFANQYDQGGNLTKVIHPNSYDEATDQGEGQSLVYDTNKRLIKTVNPSGEEARIKYDPVGNILQSITANNYNESADNGESLSYTYDELNRVKAIKDKNGHIISQNVYDEVGNVVKTIDSEGYETLFTYNMAGWLLETKEPLKEENGIVYYRQTKFKYDQLGRTIKEYKSKEYVTKNSNAQEFNIINYTYNKNNQVTSVTDSTGASIQYKYNNLSQLVEQKTQINNDVFNIKRYEYDKLGRITKEIQVIEGNDIADSQNETEEAVTTYTYDKNGNLTQVVSPLGYKTIFTYNANNQLIKKEEEVESDWLNETHVKASIYSPKNKVYENNRYTYKVKIDTTENISELNFNIKYDPRLFEIDNIEKPNDNITINTDTVGKIAIKSTNTYNTGKTDILEIQLKTKSQILGIGYIAFEENSTYKNQEGVEKPFTELTGQRVDMTGPDINQNQKVEINDLALTAMQVGKESSIPHFNYQYDTNNDGQIDTADLTYISKWLSQNKSSAYKQLGISQNKNKIIRNAYTKGSNKVIRETRYEYDKAGNLIKETDLEGSIQYTYDLQNNLIKQVDKSGSIYSYKYDQEGNIIKEIKPENYNTATDDGAAVTYTYDYLGRVTHIRDEENQVVQKNIYNIKGQLIQQMDQKGYQSGSDDASRYKTEYTYDIGGRVLTITTPEANEKGKNNTTYTYDAQDNVLTIRDGEGNRTTYVRDLWGRAETIEDAKGNRTAYTYDYAGNVITTTDQKGNTTTYRYNSQNRLKTITDPEGKEIHYKYDLEGRVIQEKDRLGQEIHYRYNRDNNLTQKSIEGQNQDQYYLYNQMGRLQVTITNNGIERYGYTNNGLLKDKIFNNETMLSYTYNKNNQLDTLTDAQGNITAYTYDVQSRLKEIKDDTNTLATYNYANNQLTNVIYSNGISINYNYNKDNQITGITHNSSSNQAINTFAYIYDANGNIIEKQENGQSTKYQYDHLYQLTKVVYPNNVEERFTYDLAGNRQEKVLKQTISSGESVSTIKETLTKYQYNNLNQLTKTIQNDIITTYTYDKNGNLLRENNSNQGTTYYKYDGYNRLLNITKPDGSYQTNYYSVGNLRTAIEENGIYTGFTYNAGQVINELTSHGEVKRTNIIGYRQVATKDSINEIYYYLHDAHGDITGIFNQQGNMQNTYTYDAFGNITAREELISNRYTYAGEQYDSITGQYYLRARYYNPVIGRFYQEDSYRGDGLNLYAYVSNNPIMYVDPSGHGKDGVTNNSSSYTKKWYDYAWDEVQAGFNRGNNLIFTVLDAPGNAVRNTFMNVANGNFKDIFTDFIKGITGEKRTSVLDLGISKEDQQKFAESHPILYQVIDQTLSLADPTILTGGGKGVSYLDDLYRGSKNKLKNIVTKYTDDFLDDASKMTQKATKGTSKTIKHPVLDNTRIGSALKDDFYHNFDDIIDNYAKEAQRFDLPNKKGHMDSLYQVEGSMVKYKTEYIKVKNNAPEMIQTKQTIDGVFEWVVDPTSNTVTHRTFIPGGKVTGKINQWGK